MAIIQGTKRIPIKWKLRFLAPKNYFTVASGKLVNKVVEPEGFQRTLFEYKIDENEKCIPDRIGFIMGQFSNIHQLEDLKEVC